MNLKYIRRNETFGQMLRDLAHEHPNREAIIYKDQRITFQQLLLKVEQLAVNLMDLGIQSGDHLCILLPNCPEYFYIVGALAYIGGVAVPMSVQSGSQDMAHILGDSEAVGVFSAKKGYGNDLISMIMGLKPTLPDLKHIIVIENDQDKVSQSKGDIHLFSDLIETQKETAHLVPVGDPKTIAMIMYTSGTTGVPKGAMHSHRTLLMGMHLYLGKLNQMIKPSWGLIKSGLKTIKTFRRIPWLLELLAAFLLDLAQVKLLVMSPFYHIAGYFQVLIVMLTGGKIIIMERFHPREALRLIQEERVTLIFGVPPMFKAMMDRPDFNEFDLSSLALSVTGAMSVPPTVVRDMKEKIGGLVLIAYGATEMAGGMFTWATDPDEKQEETVGHKDFIEGLEVRIVDDTRQEVKQGEIGEIAVRAPSLMEGYYKQSGATSRALDSQGWYYSGDLGFIDEEGYVKVLGRRGDMIIRGGVNVYPVEIENFLLTHPKIKRVAVIGVPGDAGETIRAYIVLEENVTMDSGEVSGYCWGEIAAYKIPEEVVFVDDLPVTSASQKVQHYKLRQEAMSEKASQGIRR